LTGGRGGCRRRKRSKSDNATRCKATNKVADNASYIQSKNHIKTAHRQSPPRPSKHFFMLLLFQKSAIKYKH
jgi:hypothetical protein